MIGFLQRAAKTALMGNIPMRSRATLIYLGVAKRVVQLSERRIPLNDGAVYLSDSNLAVDQAVFFEVFRDECYLTNYQDSIVLDIGAHKGYFGAYALQKGARSVYSYEPASDNYSYLERTADLFVGLGFDWKIQKTAIGAEDGEVDIYISRDSWSHSLYVRKDRPQVGTETVQMISMQRLLEEVKIEEGSRLIVKVDTEGGECSIVMESPAESWHQTDEVFVETHSFAPCTMEDIEKHLQFAGFNVEESRANNITRLLRDS